MKTKHRDQIPSGSIRNRIALETAYAEQAEREKIDALAEGREWVSPNQKYWDRQEELERMESRLGVSNDGSPAWDPHSNKVRGTIVVGSTAHNAYQSPSLRVITQKLDNIR